MSLYDDKGFEEIKAIVQRFSNTYKERYGHEPDPQILKVKLEELIQEKQERHFRSVFESMSPNNIHMAIQAFTNPPTADDADAVRNLGQSTDVKVTLEVSQDEKQDLSSKKVKRGRKAKETAQG